MALIYKLVFSGRVLAGYSVDEVKAAVKQRLSLGDSKIDAMFSGRKAILKRSEDVTIVSQFLTLMTSLGAETAIETEDPPSPVEAPNVSTSRAAAAPSPIPAVLQPTPKIHTATEPVMQMRDSELRSRCRDIDSLDVSDGWKSRFKLLEKAGASEGLLNYLKMYRKRLSFKETYTMGGWSRLLGFLFGPTYYVAKGMWKKGIVLLFFTTSFALLAELIASLLNFELPPYAFVGLCGVFGSLAAYDFYRKKVFGEEIWPTFSYLEKTPIFVATAIGAFAVLVWLGSSYISDVRCSSPVVKRTVKEILFEQWADALASRGSQSKVPMYDLEVLDIITVRKDAKLDKIGCRAELRVHSKDGKVVKGAGGPITYTAQSMDDGRVYVEVGDRN